MEFKKIRLAFFIKNKFVFSTEIEKANFISRYSEDLNTIFDAGPISVPLPLLNIQPEVPRIIYSDSDKNLNLNISLNRIDVVFDVFNDDIFNEKMTKVINILFKIFEKESFNLNRFGFVLNALENMEDGKMPTDYISKDLIKNTDDFSDLKELSFRLNRVGCIDNINLNQIMEIRGIKDGKYISLQLDINTTEKEINNLILDKEFFDKFITHCKKKVNDIKEDLIHSFSLI